MLAATTSTSDIRVLLIDDHSVVRAGLRMLIENNPELRVVAEAATPTEALEVTQREQPDIILLDLDLGGDNGSDILPRLLEVTDHRARAILLTGVQDVEAHREAIRRGASGLVKKEQAAETLIKAIKKVNAGEIWLERAMTATIFREFRGSGRTSIDAEEAKIASLTDREHDVIELVGEGLKNKEIADRLFISDSTVRHHLTSIYEKLGVSDRLELVIYAYKHGLVNLK